MPRDSGIYVSPHAVERAIDRLRNRDPKPHGYPELDTTLRVEEWIREQARAAIVNGRRRREKAAWALMFGEKARPLPDGQWFLFDPSSVVGSVAGDVDREVASCRIITTLVRVSSIPRERSAR